MFFVNCAEMFLVGPKINDIAVQDGATKDRGDPFARCRQAREAPRDRGEKSRRASPRRMLPSFRSALARSAAPSGKYDRVGVSISTRIVSSIIFRPRQRDVSPEAETITTSLARSAERR